MGDGHGASELAIGEATDSEVVTGVVKVVEVTTLVKTVIEVIAELLWIGFELVVIFVETGSKRRAKLVEIMPEVTADGRGALEVMVEFARTGFRVGAALVGTRDENEEVNRLAPQVAEAIRTPAVELLDINAAFEVALEVKVVEVELAGRRGPLKVDVEVAIIVVEFAGTKAAFEVIPEAVLVAVELADGTAALKAILEVVTTAVKFAVDGRVVLEGLTVGVASELELVTGPSILIQLVVSGAAVAVKFLTGGDITLEHAVLMVVDETEEQVQEVAIRGRETEVVNNTDELVTEGSK